MPVLVKGEEKVRRMAATAHSTSSTPDTPLRSGAPGG